MSEDADTLPQAGAPLIEQMLTAGVTMLLGTVAGLAVGACLCSGPVLRLLAGS